MREEDSGDLLVDIRGAGHGIHHKKDQIAFIDCQKRLVLYHFVHGFAAVEHNSAGVYQLENLAIPFHVLIFTVAGDTCLKINYGSTFAAKPVEQGRFSHIGASHDRDYVFSHFFPYQFDQT